MNRVIVLLLLTVLVYNSNGQELNRFKSSVFYAELAGNAYNQISINYEKVFSDRKKVKFGFRAGFGLGGLFENLDYSESAIMTNIFGFVGEKKSHLEFGVGLSFLKGSFVVNDMANSTIYMPLNLSYRFQPPTKGVFFRVGFSTLFKIVDLIELDLPVYTPVPKFIWTFGLAAGYSFSKKIKSSKEK